MPIANIDCDDTNTRLAELCEILALGVMRLQARQSSGISALLGESSLDCAGRQSGDANRFMAAENSIGEGGWSSAKDFDRRKVGRKARHTKAGGFDVHRCA